MGRVLSVVTVVALAALYVNLDARRIGAYRDPEKLWVDALAHGRDNACALMGLGTIAMDRGQPDVAIPLFERAVKLQPTSWAAHDNLGVALMRVGRLPEAIGHLETALRTCTTSGLNQHINLAIALAATGDHAQAASHLKSAMLLGPNSSAVFFNISYAQMINGDKAGAIASAEKALQLAREQERPGLVAHLRQLRGQ